MFALLWCWSIGIAMYSLTLVAGVREQVAVKEGPEWLEALGPTKDDAVLENLGEKEMEEVFHLMDKKHNFERDLRKALEAAKESGGACPTTGPWKEMGCAPFKTALQDQKCKCTQYFLERQCLLFKDQQGEFEERLDLNTARKLYAGVCHYNPHGLQLKALAGLIVFVVTIAAWCVISGRAAAEMRAQEELQKAEEETVTPVVQDLSAEEQNRQDQFNQLVEKCNNLNELATKVSSLPDPPDVESFVPIKSNIYRFWALGGKKPTWLHYFGLRFVWLIQVVAPFAILRENFSMYDWWHWEVKFVSYEYGSNVIGVSHLLGRLLQVLFIYCIGLHSLHIVQQAAKDNSLLASLFDELKRRKTAEHPEGRASISSTGQMFVGRWSQTCLFLDCIMMCYVVTLGLIDMVAIFTSAGGPKDVVFDSLALLFVFHIHEVEGGLSFVRVQDFNERRIGELCARVSPPDEGSTAELTGKQKRAKKRSLQRTQQRSFLFLMTETFIYVILLLIPVYQLFLQDGLPTKNTSLSQGTLAAHIVQDEARLSSLTG